MRFVATCARGTEHALAEELRVAGVAPEEPDVGAVAFEGPLDTGYRALLWTRIASRLLVPLAELDAPDPERLYEGVRAIAWQDHLGPRRTFAVHCVAAAGERIHTRYWALKTKDAIADHFRERAGARPDVDTARPDVRVHVHVAGGRASVAIDLGGPLHLRGYRREGAPAPLRETLAAAIVRLAGAAEVEGPIVDPLCGSGTLLAEAGLLVRDVAPGLLRRGSDPSGWGGHDAALYARLLAECRERRAAAAARPLVLVGSDRSARALELAATALARAGLEGAFRLERRELAEAVAPSGPPGLVVTNPPYGDRLGQAAELFLVYQTLGDVLRRRFLGYRAAVLAPRGRLAKNLGLKPDAKHPLMNGPIECALLAFRIRDEPVREDAAGPGWRKPTEDAPMLANRLRKNEKRLGKLARREGVEAYRVYDADIPEYNVAIDRYADHVLVQEYAPPRSVDPARAEAHLKDVLLVVPEALGVPAANVHLKVRRRQLEGRQYEASEAPEVRLWVREAGLELEVELERHLDTGLFSDHRLLRARAAKASVGVRFLNLFAYTCAASVHAAKAGASSTTSVDLSARYLEWGMRNFERNGLDPRAHRFERSDCMGFLARERARYGVIFLNPPSYSRSKATTGDFDVKRDHPALLRSAMERLERGGVLFFSTHALGFELDPEVTRAYRVDEITRATVPPDFERSPHRSFEVRAR